MDDKKEADFTVKEVCPVIYKYKLVAEFRNGIQSVTMPKGATILTARFQGHDLCLWAVVDPAAEPEPRMILAAGTDEQDVVIPGAKCISTAQSGGLVWHIFEVGACSN